MASAPPLPLLKFLDSRVQREPARTIAGLELQQPRCPKPALVESHAAGHASGRADVTTGLRLSRWFAQRGLQEKIFRNQDRRNSVRQRSEPSAGLSAANRDGEMSEGDSQTDSSPQRVIIDSIVYLCPPFDDNASPNLTPAVEFTQDRRVLESSLVFDSCFESGNMEMARRVEGRADVERAINSSSNSSGAGAGPRPVDQEYDLTIRNDVNTSGNIQWFFFSAQAPDFKTAPKRAAALRFPLRVRFNLINMQKADSLYNYGLLPALCAIPANDCSTSSVGWTHSGCYDVSYYCNERTYKVDKGGSGCGARKKFYTLSFSFDFQSPSHKAFFAHCFPYTYSDLQVYLEQLEQDKRAADLLHRKLLCTTLAGNRCDMLIISERSTDLADDVGKPAVIISARVHPGESNSSFIMEGLIDFLLSPCEEAQLLRSKFVFKIVPMLNPDGVIHGNYRCSLVGTDLNRRYLSPQMGLLPTISAFKAMLSSTASSRGVFLFLDLHGHSKKKNSFLYGNDATQQTPKQAAQSRLKLSYNEQHIFNQRVHARLFPHILSSVSNSEEGSGYFRFDDCSFGVQRSKKGTGRVVCWRELGIEASYTVETSFCGNGSNADMKRARRHFQHGGGLAMPRASGAAIEETLYSVADYSTIGRHILRAILHYANIDPSTSAERRTDAAAPDDLSRTFKSSTQCHIPQLGAELLLLPVLFPAVFDPLLLQREAVSSRVRLTSESRIRTALHERAAAEAASAEQGNGIPESDSDSEPSVNDGPAVKMLLERAPPRTSGRGSTRDLMKILRQHMAEQANDRAIASSLSADGEEVDLPSAAETDRSDASSTVSSDGSRPGARLIYHSVKRKVAKPRAARPMHQTSYKIDRKFLKNNSSSPEYIAIGSMSRESITGCGQQGREQPARPRRLSLQDGQGDSLDGDTESYHSAVRAPKPGKRTIQYSPSAYYAPAPERAVEHTADILDDLTSQIRAFHPSVPMRRLQLHRGQKTESERRSACGPSDGMKPFNESEPQVQRGGNYGSTDSQPSFSPGSQLRAIVFRGSGHSPPEERSQRHSPASTNSPTFSINGHKRSGALQQQPHRASDAIFRDLRPEQVSRRVGQDVPVRLSNDQLVLRINPVDATASSAYLSSGSASLGAGSGRSRPRQREPLSQPATTNSGTGAGGAGSPSSFSAEVDKRRAQRGSK